MKNIHNISAGAGSGKTTRLVEVITDLVSGKKGEKCSPERMILTTFTKAAAKEFKERSASRLIEMGFLDEAVTLDAAMIGTIHSIAQTYITRYWYLCGISPDVTTVPEDEARKMLDKSLASVVTHQESFFRDYVDIFSILKKGKEKGRDYDFWKFHLNKLIETVMFEEDKVRYIEGLRDRSVTLLKQVFDLKRNTAILEEAKLCAERYLVYCKNDSLYGKNSQNRVNQIKEVIGIILAKGKTSYPQAQLKGMMEVLKKPFAVIARKKDDYEEDVKAANKALADVVSRIMPEEAELIPKCAEMICDIAIAGVDSYRKMKVEQGLMDFNDMEVLFLELLGKKEVLEDIRSSIDYLFVDEFQDCNPVQIRIFEILSDNVKQSWFVGDPKQAIYGFRGSNIELVNEFYKHFPKDVVDEDSFTGFKKDENGLSSEILGKSYRSHHSLVNLANKVFTKAFEADLEKDKIELVPGRKCDESTLPTLHHFILEGGNEQQRSKALANGVTMLLNGDYPYLKGFKSDPSDIAILVRGNDQALAIATALTKNGVPVSYVDKEFKKSAEVALILTLLRMVSGRQDRKSVAELYSLIEGMTLKSVLEKAKSKDEGSFWGGLRGFVKSVRHLSVLDCIEAIVARFDLYNFVSRWGNADVRRANIDLVRKVARQFDTNASSFAKASDIAAFLLMIDSYSAEQKFENGAGVKVLTYHKAKGLEWPIVLMDGVAGDISGKMTISEIIGLNGGFFFPRMPEDAIWVTDAAMSHEQLIELMPEAKSKHTGEERRLLYVGLTRAKDFAFTIGYAQKGMAWLQRCCPSAAKIDYSKVSQGEYDIWGVGYKSCCHQLASDEDLVYDGVQAQSIIVKGAGFDLPEDAADMTYVEKYHSPSKYEDPDAVSLMTAVKMKLPMELPHLEIKHDHLEDYEFGDCVHHIYAACSHLDKGRGVKVAERILGAYGVDTKHAAELLKRHDQLCDYLRTTYGDSEKGVAHEFPFKYQDAHGRVFNGTMDMVWKTKCGSVIVDYKTFSGSAEDALNRTVKEYGSQMKIYRSALEGAGETVADVLIFYPIAGLVVKVN